MYGLGPHIPVVPLANEAANLPDMFERRVQQSGECNAFFEKTDGVWTGTSWNEWSQKARHLAQGFVEQGIQPGDRVAILGSTRPQWALYEMGAQMAGCISLGIYPKQSVSQVRYILEHSEARVVFVESKSELDTVLQAVENLDSVEYIVPWTDDLLGGREDRRLTPASAFCRTDGDDLVLRERRSSRQTNDTAIFVYTSGTTGPPKCAMISHGNILAVLSSQNGLLEFYQDDISLSFLPMAHVAERVLAFYGRISAGIATAYATSISAVLTELGEVRPTVFGSVPRIFEKAYSRIRSEIPKKSHLVQSIFAWAEAVGRKRIRFVLDDQPVPFFLAIKYRIADRLVFKKVRAAFGGRVRQFLTGAAPIPVEILEFFWAAGLPIYEVYGQTEATVITHGNMPGATRLGTVGQIVPALEQRLAEDGEILIRGPFVFQGYYKDPEASAQTVVDGWLHTGDIGVIDDDGFLKITDRKKHIMITAGGKNLSPANIENSIKAADPLISHVHAHADKRPYVSALIAPSPIETLEFGVDLGLVTAECLAERSAELMDNPTARTVALSTAMAPVTEHPAFQGRILQAVSKGNGKLSQVEQVKRVVILQRDLSQEAGELTPTMKVKRKQVEDEYADILGRIYEEDGYALPVE